MISILSLCKLFDVSCELIIWGQSSNQNSKKSAQTLVRTSAHKPQFLQNYLLSLWGWTCMTFGAVVRPPTLPLWKFSNLQSSVLLNSRTNHSLLCTMRSLLSKCSCEFDSHNVKWNLFAAGSFCWSILSRNLCRAVFQIVCWINILLERNWGRILRKAFLIIPTVV